jgi:6-phosphofructokinase 1
MVTLEREPGPIYKCTTGLAPLDVVANAEKLLPKEFINDRGNGITEQFREYALPLLGDALPEYVRLEGFPVPKRA